MSNAVAPAELRELIDTDPAVRILDVRTGAEFETVHIAGSYNVPLDLLGEHVREFADVDRPMVVVCQSGARADQACTKLEAAGKHDLRLLKGGIAAWESEGGDVVRGEQRWAMERQVRLVAGSIVVASVLASTLIPKAKWLAAGIGAGLTYSALSNTCTMGDVLAKMPYNQTEVPDPDQVLSDFTAAA